MEDKLIEFEEKPKAKIHIIHWLTLFAFVVNIGVNVYIILIHWSDELYQNGVTAGFSVGVFFCLLLNQIRTLVFNKNEKKVA